MARITELGNSFSRQGKCSWCNRDKGLWIELKKFEAIIGKYRFENDRDFAFCSQRCFENWTFTHAACWPFQVREKLVFKPDDAWVRLLRHRRFGKLMAESVEFEVAGKRVKVCVRGKESPFNLEMVEVKTE